MKNLKQTDDINLLSSHSYESATFHTAHSPMQSRRKCSSGVWLVGLLPFAFGPGFYSVHAHCRPSPRIASLLAIELGLASLYVLYDAWFSPITKKAVKPGKANLLLLKLLMNKFLIPSVLTFSALCYFTNLHLLVALGSSVLTCYVFYTLTKWTLTNFEASFTFGEAMLVCQGGTMTVLLSILGLISRPKKLSTEYQQIVCFIQVAVLVCVLCLIGLWKTRRRLDLTRFCCVMAACGLVGVVASSALLGELCFLWLFQLTVSSPTRIALVGWWANLTVLITMATMVSQRFNKVSQTVLRKSFHLLMVAIVVPGVILDPLLTFLASVAVTMIFILLEFVRVCRIQPISGVLDSTFYMFLDEKDGGPLVLSHIYLLIGLMCPLWIYPCSYADVSQLTRTRLLYSSTAFHIQFTVLPLLAGVLSVGIGDTAASIGGTYLGRLKWPRTNKTIEGSLCSFVLQLASVTAIVYGGSIAVDLESWPKIIISILISTVVEALTDQVDNLVLPLLLYTPLMDP